MDGVGIDDGCDWFYDKLDVLAPADAEREEPRIADPALHAALDRTLCVANRGVCESLFEAEKGERTSRTKSTIRGSRASQLAAPVYRSSYRVLLDLLRPV